MSEVLIGIFFVLGVGLGLLITGSTLPKQQCVQSIVFEGQARCVAWVDRDIIK